MRRAALEYYRSNEQRHLRGYRDGHVTAAECQEAACLAAIAAYLLETSATGGPRGAHQAVTAAPAASYAATGQTPAAGENVTARGCGRAPAARWLLRLHIHASAC